MGSLYVAWEIEFWISDFYFQYLNDLFQFVSAYPHVRKNCWPTLWSKLKQKKNKLTENIAVSLSTLIFFTSYALFSIPLAMFKKIIYFGLMFLLLMTCPLSMV